MEPEGEAKARVFPSQWHRGKFWRKNIVVDETEPTNSWPKWRSTMSSTDEFFPSISLKWFFTRVLFSGSGFMFYTQQTESWTTKLDISILTHWPGWPFQRLLLKARVQKVCGSEFLIFLCHLDFHAAHFYRCVASLSVNSVFHREQPIKLCFLVFLNSSISPRSSQAFGKSSDSKRDRKAFRRFSPEKLVFISRIESITEILF